MNWIMMLQCRSLLCPPLFGSVQTNGPLDHICAISFTSFKSYNLIEHKEIKDSWINEWISKDAWFLFKSEKNIDSYHSGTIKSSKCRFYPEDSSQFINTLFFNWCISKETILSFQCCSRYSKVENIINWEQPHCVSLLSPSLSMIWWRRVVQWCQWF